MRVLWVKPGGFLPLDSGGKIRSYHTVTNLARHWETTVITFYPEERQDQNPALAESVHKLITVPFRMPAAGAPATYLGAVLHNRPFMFQKFCRPKVVEAVKAELKSTPYDVVICDFLLGCGVVPDKMAAFKVVFTHNVENRIWERHVRVAPNWWRKKVAEREWRSLAALEHHHLGAADLVLAVSQADADEFISWGISPEKVKAVPTGVDTEYFAPRPGMQSSSTIVFTGSMDWRPNQDGVLWFLDNVYPAIKSAVPAAKLQIVGRKPPAEIVQACAQHRDVSVTGWVDDVRDYVAAADVCIVPLRVGSGTRLKIFEAMAMGKAVVSTTIGAEGLPITHGKDILIADSKEDFAARTAEVLNSVPLQRALGTAARQMVESKYSWAAVTGEFAGAINTALDAKQTHSKLQ